MTDPLALMAAHRSVRSFRPTPVPDEVVERAVAAASHAATSSWIQAYALVQVTDPGERARLATLCGGQPQVERAGAFFVVCGDVRRHRLIAARAGVPCAQNLETFLLAVIDASLFAQNLALAFESQGLGICFIGGLRNRLADASALLELPAGVWPLYGLCAGEPDPEVPAEPRPRLAARALWSKDRYPTDAEVLAGVDAFDEIAAEHYAGRGLAGRTWSGAIERKFTRPSREHLHEFYTARGARLE